MSANYEHLHILFSTHKTVLYGEHALWALLRMGKDILGLMRPGPGKNRRTVTQSARNANLDLVLSVPSSS